MSNNSNNNNNNNNNNNTAKNTYNIRVHTMNKTLIIMLK